jgi:hypothetical protein
VAAGPPATTRNVWHTETVIFLVTWLILMITGRDSFFGDPGVFWHTVVGQRILSSGQFPQIDPFSFTCGGQPWIANQWLGECVMALLHRIGGLDSLLLATATLLACLYTWVAHRLLRAGLHPLLAVLIMVLAMLASSYHFLARPHLVTIVFLGWVFARLCDFEAGRIPLARLFWLIPLFVVWSNVHGGVLGGMGTLALAVGGWGVTLFGGKDSPLVHYRQLIALGFLVILCGLTAFLNPYGTALPASWFAVLGSPVVAQYMDEHAPLLQSGPEGLGVLLFGLFYVTALLGVLPRRPRVTWLIPLLWLGLAWTRIRNGPLFAITAAIALADMFAHIRWAAWLARRGSAVFRVRGVTFPKAAPGMAWRWASVPVLLTLTVLVLQGFSCPLPVLGRGWVQLNSAACPGELLPALRQYARERPDGTPVFNEMVLSGFVIYHTPGLRVFIDDRCELYGDARLLAYGQAVLKDPAQIDRWALEYNFDLALVQAASRADRYLATAAAWTVVGRTRAAALYRRTRSIKKVDP